MILIVASSLVGGIVAALLFWGWDYVFLLIAIPIGGSLFGAMAALYNAWLCSQRQKAGLSSQASPDLRASPDLKAHPEA
jgi:hypothetical protein